MRPLLANLERHVAATGDVLTESQIAALERKQDDDVAHGEIETAHPGYLGSQDKIYLTIAELQADLDEWLQRYNAERTHQGKMCCGRTPLQTLIDGKEAWRDKIDALNGGI